MVEYVRLAIYPHTREKLRKIAERNYRGIADQVALLVDQAYAEMDKLPRAASPTPNVVPNAEAAEQA